MRLFNFNKKKETENNKTPVERYLEHLSNIFQQKPQFYDENSLIDGLPAVTSIVYPDIPEKGFITAFTYGLSLVKHSDWKFGRPELCISVESQNLEWRKIVGYVANKLRGDCPFLMDKLLIFVNK